MKGMELKPSLRIALSCSPAHKVCVVLGTYSQVRIAILKRILRSQWIHERFMEISPSIHRCEDSTITWPVWLAKNAMIFKIKLIFQESVFSGRNDAG